MKLEEKLMKCFNNYSKSTCRIYCKWIRDLIKWHYNYHNQWVEPEKMTQWHIDEYLAWLVRPAEYSISSTNQAKIAIKHYFVFIDNPVNIKLVSTRNFYRSVVVVERSLIIKTIDTMTKYNNIAKCIYYDLKRPQKAIENYKTVLPWLTSNLTLKTVNEYLRRANKSNKKITTKTLFQSGVVHQLQDNMPWCEVARKANLSESSIRLRYMPKRKFT